MKRLSVYAGEHLVGHLNEGEGNDMSFVYSPNWLTNPEAIPLSSELPLADQVFRGDPVTAFFENLLPEGDVLEFISKAAHISSGNIFGLLERFGGDTAGAFSILPEDMQPSGQPHYLPVTPESILQWFDRSRGIPLDLSGEQARMSLSGAQDKMTVFIDANGNISIPLGAAPSSHIIKPSLQHRYDIPNTAINEAMIMMLARHSKLDVAEVRYVAELGAVVISRYDREIGADGRLRRLHQNDLCQVLGITSGKKYESEGGPSLKTCFETVLAHSTQPALDKKRLIEWVIFNVLVGNMDGHAKNLSLITIGKRTRLAPFYDLVCTTVYPNLSQKLAFRIGGENRPRWLMARHWDRFAEEIATKPQFVRRVMADLIQRVESALPGATDMLRSADSTPDEWLMIEHIQERVLASVAQMKTRLGVKH
ncbi:MULTISPECIES: type II toxin-antitoxin system HipA family toxin [Methylobacter]|uniref:type II toxin-antitoxin system HipA family toxin n=1 Tax=Methylobacter TaxID=429 RepID=UPI0003601343|nr:MULTISPECIES: type II toxin-antitoxin system HipA family toxin [Methylobacter]